MQFVASRGKFHVTKFGILGAGRIGKVNANTIANGVIARVTAVLTPSGASAVISIRDSLGASASGDFIPIASAGGTITRARMSPDRRLHPPLMRIAGRCLPQ